MIKPAYQTERVTVYHGDCLEIMPQPDSESIDMIWTDPPYGHGNHDGDLNARLNEHRGIEDKPIANDGENDMRRVIGGMLTEAVRVMKADCCCCCCCGGGGGPKPTFAWLALRMDSDGLEFFHSVIWDKRNPGLGWRYRRRHEMMMVAHRTGGKLLWANDKKTQANIISAYPPRERLHPNEKPIEYVGQVMVLHANSDNIVLDPFLGSGVSGIAALSAGARFIGIELERRYIDIAIRRLEAEEAQGRLF